MHSAGVPGSAHWPGQAVALLPSHCSPNSMTPLPHAVLHVQFARHAPGQLSSSAPSHSSAVRFFAPSPQSAAVTAFGNEIAPGPGRPAVWLIACPVVAGMQNADTNVSVSVPATPVRTIGSMKQRWFFETHGPLPAGQSLLF